MKANLDCLSRVQWQFDYVKGEDSQLQCLLNNAKAYLHMSSNLHGGLFIAMYCIYFN